MPRILRGMRATWLEINLDALAHNLRAIRKHLPPGTGVIGVVKANAYGHGAGRVGRELERLGVERLAVATLREGMELRTAGCRLPIHLLGSLHPLEADDVAKTDLIPTLATLDAARALAAAHPGARIHVKIDTGMSRVGIQPRELADFLRSMEELGIVVEGLFTHFASADQDEAFTNKQLEHFLRTTQGLNKHYLLHAANSAGLIYPGAALDFVRPGIALYGLRPSPTFPLPLRPVLAWKAYPTQVKRLSAGSRIGYGGRYIAEEDQWVATLPLGYADGFPRAWSNRGTVRLDHAYCPVVGMVSMDQITVRLPGPIPLASVFEIITPDHDPKTSLEGQAIIFGTIHDELAAILAARLGRHYLQGNEPSGNVT